MTTPDVFLYLDYRQFLRDVYAHHKAASPRFSYRQFALRAGLGSPSYLKLVMDAKRNLSGDMARRFATALKLNKNQTRFFVALVGMNQAKTTAARTHYYNEMSRVPRFREVRTLERNHYDYYERWYCVPIRELVARADFREDPAWIAEQLLPPITPNEAARAVELLLSLGMLERGEDGKLRQATPLLSTGTEVHSLGVRRFHRDMLQHATAALESVPLHQREVGGVTLRLTEAQMQTLKQRLYEVRQEILAHDGAGTGPEAVYHFSFQLFPLSLVGGGESDAK